MPSPSADGLRAVILGDTDHGGYGHGLDMALCGVPGVRVVAVADPSPEGREAARIRSGAVSAYANWREMLGRERPDLAVVAPRQASRHAEWVLGCLETGSHVLCEKPFVTCPAEADAVLAAADERGLRVAVAHQMSLDPSVLELRRRLEQGALGELRVLRGWGKQDARGGGEDMIVLGSHVFDLMRRLAGEPEACFARVHHNGRPITSEDARVVSDDVGPVAGDGVDAEFAFARGVTGSFRSRAGRRDDAPPYGLELEFSAGSARIAAGLPARVSISLRGPGPATEDALPVPQGSAAAANRRLVDDWLESIREEREPACSGRDGAWAVEMAVAVYASALCGR